ncbi:hypothetical protein [Nocardia sp. NPDC050793]|uniref:hypothetical protein n=1 Tax=Nocardia sp. NPDC050793 TaxID=3155159 RepID=UPI0033E2D64F
MSRLLAQRFTSGPLGWDEPDRRRALDIGSADCVGDGGVLNGIHVPKGAVVIVPILHGKRIRSRVAYS